MALLRRQLDGPHALAAAALLGARLARRLQAEQAPVAGDDPVSVAVRSTSGAMVWVAPVSVLVGGLVLPVPLALVLYGAVNGTWTTLQTWLLARHG